MKRLNRWLSLVWLLPVAFVVFTFAALIVNRVNGNEQRAAKEQRAAVGVVIGLFGSFFTFMFADNVVSKRSLFRCPCGGTLRFAGCIGEIIELDVYQCGRCSKRIDEQGDYLDEQNNYL